MQLGRAGGRRPYPRRAPPFVHASEASPSSGVRRSLTRCGRPSATATRARSGVDAGVVAPQALHGIGRRASLSASSRTTWISRRPSSASRSRVESPTLISCLDVRPAFPTTTEIVVTSSLTKPRTLISTGLSVSNANYTGAQVPNRVPVDRLADTVREAVNPVTMRVCEWRDPDSNRGHHDFQSWSRISLTAAESLQIRQFVLGDGAARIAADCGCLSLVWALGHVPVPNQDRSASAGVPATAGRPRG
jgi:hypothetical protein